jgi:hypothetical protein
MRENLLNAYKGIAPGKIIAHGLKKKKISTSPYKNYTIVEE